MLAHINTSVYTNEPLHLFYIPPRSPPALLKKMFFTPISPPASPISLLPLPLSTCSMLHTSTSDSHFIQHLYFVITKCIIACHAFGFGKGCN